MQRNWLRIALIAGIAAGAAPAFAADTPGLDQVPGQRFHITAEGLPVPGQERAASNGSRLVGRDGATPIVAEGFSITAFADGIGNPRHLLAIAPDTVLVAQQALGQIFILIDKDGDGTADHGAVLISGLDRPYGLALIPEGEFAGDVLVADTRAIWRLPIKSGGSGRVLVTELGAFGSASGHITRSLAIDPRDGTLYVGVGSISNIGVEALPKASIQAFDADGKNQRTFASGMRNPMGIGFSPLTGKLWSMVQERDGMGDHLVPDYFTEVNEGDFFGWPYAYSGGKPQPGYADKAPELVAKTKLPSVLFEAHSSAMDFVFVPKSWPADWQGDAIAALHGSWNRGEPTGYKLVRVLFKDGKPTGEYQNFVTGFWVSGDGPANVWGRPANLELMADGALLVADDIGNTIWKITPPANP